MLREPRPLCHCHLLYILIASSQPRRHFIVSPSVCRQVQSPQRYNTNGHSKPQKGIPFECITSRRGGSACSIYRVTRPSDYLSYRLNIPQHSRVYYVLRLYVIMAGSVTPFCSLPPSDSDSWSTSTKRNSTPIAAMNFKESSKQDTDECELSTPLTYSPSRFHFRLSSNLRVAKCQC
jgi:hypothetical protein